MAIWLIEPKVFSDSRDILWKLLKKKSLKNTLGQ